MEATRASMKIANLNAEPIDGSSPILARSIGGIVSDVRLQQENHLAALRQLR
jgi:CRISPR/Cas system type I-B associated protein Csh2 (Cas7 group RAMP superfamily)